MPAITARRHAQRHCHPSTHASTRPTAPSHRATVTPHTQRTVHSGEVARARGSVGKGRNSMKANRMARMRCCTTLALSSAGFMGGKYLLHRWPSMSVPIHLLGCPRLNKTVSGRLRRGGDFLSDLRTARCSVSNTQPHSSRLSAGASNTAMPALSPMATAVAVPPLCQQACARARGGGSVDQVTAALAGHRRSEHRGTGSACACKPLTRRSKTHRQGHAARARQGNGAARVCRSPNQAVTTLRLPQAANRL